MTKPWKFDHNPTRFDGDESYLTGGYNPPETKPMPILEIMGGSSYVPLEEAMRRLGYESPEELKKLREPEDLADDPRVSVASKEKKFDGFSWKLEQLETEIFNLRGHIRRLEKSNQTLGEENHRLGGKGEGWNKNVTS